MDGIDKIREEYLARNAIEMEKDDRGIAQAIAQGQPQAVIDFLINQADVTKRARAHVEKEWHT